MKSRIAVLLLVFLCMSGCTPADPAVVSTATGQGLDPSGEIIKTSEIYRFDLPSKKGTVRDLFNYIYFEGDTLCFNVTLNRELENSPVSAHVRNPETGIQTEVERLEVLDNRVYGFSLVGSILEDFFASRLTEKTDISQWDGKQVPCDIYVHIKMGDVNIHEKISTSIQLTFHKSDD